MSKLQLLTACVHHAQLTQGVLLPQYNVTYRYLTMPAEQQDTLQQVLLDVRNGSVEHDIHRQLPGDFVNVTARGPLDSRCPQLEPFGIVRCVAHQHIGMGKWDLPVCGHTFADHVPDGTRHVHASLP